MRRKALSASLYIIFCSARNRIRVRLRRLREPRYLLGAIAGAAYFYFTIFARMGTGRPRSQRRRNNPEAPPAFIAGLTVSGPALVGMALMFLSAAAWVLPVTSGLLDFSAAEIQFLFPAPVSRRRLILYRLMRSQLGILFTSIVFAVFMPAPSGFTRLRTSIAMWLLLTTARVYFTGISLTRPRIGALRLGSGRPERQSKGAAPRNVGAAWTPVLLLAAAVAIVSVAIGRAFVGQGVDDVREALARLATVAGSGATTVVLFPFTALARPLFAQDVSAFLPALVPAVMVLAAAIAWVLHADEAFEDAATEASARQAAAQKERIAPAPKVRGGWTLPLHGRPEGIFLWKNAMQMLRATTGVSLIRYFVPLTFVAVALSTTMMTRGPAMALCTVALGIAAFTVILGPQAMRADLREDLNHLELLKTWPLNAGEVLRGEMLCPGLALTGIAWVAIVCAAILSAAGFPRLALTWRMSGAVTALMLAPALIFAQLTVHNAAAVLFPAWVPLGHSRPRGLDAMGQRLILLGAVLLTLAVMLAPGVLASAILGVIFYRFIGPAVLIPGAVVLVAIVGIEVLAATEALAPAYDRLDALSIERPE